MHGNLEESPWFHVHFTVPNQTTKRRIVHYQGERRRINPLIQERHNFLAAKDRGDTSQTNAFKQDRHQRKQYVESNKLKRRSLKLGKLRVQSNRAPQDVSSAKCTVDIGNSECKSLKLPPLQGKNYLTSTTGCHQQHTRKYNKADVKLPLKEQNNGRKDKPNNGKSLSIATCYDLYEWKPLNSVSNKPTRTPVSILKRNPMQARQKGQPQALATNSEFSGNETDNEASRLNKRVSFAKGTNFKSAKGRRRRTRKNRESDERIHKTENCRESIFELTFQEFIERKRVERTVPTSNASKDPKMLCFLREDPVHVRNPPKKTTKGQRHSYEPCIDSGLLPTITIN